MAEEEISTSSWGSRLRNAFFGILMGFALIAAAIALIFWNERHSLRTKQSLEQTAKALISVPNAPVDPKNNLKVVHISGLATTTEELTDTILGISVNAIHLHRKVKMYQWLEKTSTRSESQVGGSERSIKTYSYRQDWSSNLINSDDFKYPKGHSNPKSFLIPSQLQYAKSVTLGDFTLPDDLIKKITVAQPVNLNQVDKVALEEQYKLPIFLYDNRIYIGHNEKQPKLGDLKISLNAAYPQEVSVIAQQTGNTLQAYSAPAGEIVLLLSAGNVSAQEMIAEALTQNKIFSWMVRVAALLILIGGFSLIMKPLVVLADVLPFLGTLVGFGTGLLAVVLGLALWLIFTAIAWFATRPYVSIAMISLVFVGGYLLIKKRKALKVQPKESLDRDPT
ncbi:MAG: hypothetical protein EPN84_07820 [Legionella sp.]|nr:MAG: hypothetical protein EPN84_07820 [Legionella sp.]